LFTVI